MSTNIGNKIVFTNDYHKELTNDYHKEKTDMVNFHITFIDFKIFS